MLGQGAVEGIILRCRAERVEISDEKRNTVCAASALFNESSLCLQIFLTRLRVPSEI